MAKRPIFITHFTPPHYKEIEVEFEFHNGLAISQKRKSINSLHKAFLSNYPKHKILEISTNSEDVLGVQLSAFNLLIKTKKRQFSLEAAFQSSKVFKNGGPYKDILDMSAGDAKKDSRLQNSGELSHFCWGDKQFPLNPKTLFYDWLYINALKNTVELTSQLLKYDAFTDIAFNSKKSINCQARSAAIYVSLYHNGKLNSAVQNRDSFLEQVYGNIKSTEYTQKSIDDILTNNEY